MSTRDHPAVAAYARHVNPSFVKLLGVFGYGRLFERAEGVWLWDSEGRKYLDALAGFGTNNVGHNHPRLVARLRAALEEQAVQFCHVGPTPAAASLARELARRLGPPLEVTLFANGGAEAVEAALKLARAATGRAGVVSCEGGYHGTSLGTLSIMGAARMKKPFEPLLGECARVPFGDLARLREALAGKRAGAFVVEPVLGEGGVVLPPPGYLAEARALCAKHGTLLVLDEIQTGLGRTGTELAFQREGVVPDVVVLAKALSGGMVPIGAAVTTAELWDRAYGSMDRFDLHASTFGGGALACAAAQETLAILADEALADRSERLGSLLLRRLRDRLAGHPLVREVRGRGLLVGIELGPTGKGVFDRLASGLVSAASEKVFGQWAALRLLELGVVAQPASLRWDVLKIEPPLVIDAAEVERLVEAIGGLLDEYRSIAAVLRDAGARLGTQAARGFSF